MPNSKIAAWIHGNIITKQTGSVKRHRQITESCAHGRRSGARAGPESAEPSSSGCRSVSDADRPACSADAASKGCRSSAADVDGIARRDRLRRRSPCSLSSTQPRRSTKEDCPRCPDRGEGDWSASSFRDDAVLAGTVLNSRSLKEERRSAAPIPSSTRCRPLRHRSCSRPPLPARVLCLPPHCSRPHSRRRARRPAHRFGDRPIMAHAAAGSSMLPPTPPLTEDESSHVQKRLHSPAKAESRPPAPIWWSNAIFFCGMHVLALAGVLYLSPWRTLDRRTAWSVGSNCAFRLIAQALLCELADCDIWVRVLRLPPATLRRRS